MKITLKETLLSGESRSRSKAWAEQDTWSRNSLVYACSVSLNNSNLSYNFGFYEKKSRNFA